MENAEQAKALFTDEEENSIYCRLSNPKSSELIDQMARLEGLEIIDLEYLWKLA